jgi:hypothetical protein
MFLRTIALLLLAAASPAIAQQAAAAVDLTFRTPLPGAWSYAPFAGGSEATFRDSAGRPQLTIRCTRAQRRVTISKPASAAAPSLLVWTTSQSRSVPSGFDPATARLNAALSAYDPLLDAIAFSRGRFGVSVAGMPALVLPTWPESDRVIEDCRT